MATVPTVADLRARQLDLTRAVDDIAAVPSAGVAEHGHQRRLPGRLEGAEHRRVDRAVDVGVVEHHQRRLAAELEQDGLEIFRRHLG
jgi:hypothetical protein